MCEGGWTRQLTTLDHPWVNPVKIHYRLHKSTSEGGKREGEDGIFMLTKSALSTSEELNAGEYFKYFFRGGLDKKKGVW